METEIMKSEDNAVAVDLEGCVDECGVDYLSEYIVNIDIENLNDITFSKESFQKGVNKMSKLCGMISALVNVGIPPDMALNYLATQKANKATIDMSLKTIEMQTQANIESAKYEYCTTQKNTI